MFLRKIAQDIIKKHGNNLADIGIVFPNKRAALWMNDYLLEASDKPVFAPRYLPISDLFQKNSALQIADRILLVSILHQCYKKITGDMETLDQFFAWGEVLLADFDNIDKSLAPAEKLLQNVSNLREIKKVDYLNDEQKELLHHFFEAFQKNHESAVQAKFLRLWSKLLDIYNYFRQTLRQQNLAYEGMLYRDVVENVSADCFPLTHYYIIGFNQHLKVETELFKIIGRDKVEHIQDKTDENNIPNDARITIAQSLTDDLQARYVEQWLTEERICKGRRTAVVLCDEQLLPNVIYSLPENVGYVNITAGFPLSETFPASYAETLMTMLTEGLTKDGKRFRKVYLRNLTSLYPEAEIPNVSVAGSTESILAYCLENITNLAAKTKDGDAMTQEAVFRVYNIVCRLSTLCQQGFLEVQPITLSRLFRQLLQTTAIPFNGKPAEGIQVMGMLETRNLDFDSLLILSCNEGMMPKTGADNSVIPYSVKKAYGLNTSDDKVEIFAYNFYRLLSRCKDITLVYNASGSDTSPGEMSRFLLNLLVRHPEKIQRIALQTQQRTSVKKSVSQPKTLEDIRILVERMTSRSLSPSALNVYIRCEKMFYYQYVLDLREEMDEEDDTIDARAFGLIFHKTAELLYKEFEGGRTISKNILKSILDDKAKLRSAVNKAIEDIKAEGMEGETGMENLLKEIVLKYIQRLLKNDIKIAPFKLVSLENNYYKEFVVDTPFGQRLIKIGGAVDRLDIITNEDGRETLRVLDYKTGKPHDDKKITCVDDIFDRSNDSSPYYRQAILYSMVLQDHRVYNENHLPVIPALYYTRATGKEDEEYNPILQINGEPISNVKDIKEEYESGLQAVINEIFHKPEFTITEDVSTCAICPFLDLCRE